MSVCVCVGGQVSVFVLYVGRWVNECVCVCVCWWAGECVCVCGWVNECVCVCVCVCVCWWAG